MKRLVFLFFLLVGVAYSQSPEHRVIVGETLQLLVPGAIAGFARPGSCAKVEVEDGVVLVSGKFPGTADIILVSKDATWHLVVTVVPLYAGKPKPTMHGWAIGASPRRKEKKVNTGKSSSLPARPITPPPVTLRITENSSAGESANLTVEAVKPAREVSAPLGGSWSSSGNPAISLQAGHMMRVPALGATAAYALESLHADVRLENGFAVVVGKFAGHSQIVIVTDADVRTIPVEVTAAPPIYPPGFIPPLSAAVGRVSGTYELRYISNQQQVQNLLDFAVQGPQRSTQLHMLTSTLLAGNIGGAHVFLPSAFYRIRTPGWDVTLLDQSVKTSPLTVNGSILRGLHVSRGGWRVHGGYSSLTTFHGFLVPVQREGVAGVSYAAPLTDHSWLSPNVYYFFSSAQSFRTGHPGVVASLVYEYHPKHGPEILAEVAAGHGLASAFELRLATSHDALQLSFRQKPRAFPSLSIDNIPGLQLETAWTRQLNTKLSNSFNFSENRLLLPLGRQNNLIATENVHARISKRWSASSGVTFASFDQTGSSGSYSLGSLNLPQAINYDLPHFGTGFQYQYSRSSSGFFPGNQFRQSFRASRGALSVSVFAEHQTQGIALEALYSQIPSLQAELLRLGLGASSPQQLQSLLQDTSFLLALGLSPGNRLNLVPSRTQTGGNINWASHGIRSQQFNLGFLYSREKTLLGDSNNWDVNGSYTLQLSRKFSLTSSFSVLHLVAAGHSQYYPQAQIAIRRSFSSLPSLLSGYKSGTVSGTIFEDEEGQGKFRKGFPPLSGVEVVLDNSQRTRTDDHGFYAFRHVPEGEHSVEILFQSSKPFWFTGPAKIVTNINQERNVGVRFATAELVGYLKNDAGTGVEGAQIAVSGKSQRLNTQSDAGGRFSISGLSPGEYEVTVDSNTLPSGYLLDELKSQQISIENGTPGRVDFLIRAFRSLKGQITVYDTALGKYIPAAGVAVEIAQLARKTNTNSDGKFDFQDLPAGDFTVIVGSGEAKVSRNVTVSPEPASIRMAIELRRP